jgi:hypothetical protein
MRSAQSSYVIDIDAKLKLWLGVHVSRLLDFFQINQNLTGCQDLILQMQAKQETHQLLAL